MRYPQTLALTEHAKIAAEIRNIDAKWILECLNEPEYEEQDILYPQRVRLFRRISQNGNRWLRVVTEQIDGKELVITVFFDRKAGRSL